VPHALRPQEFGPWRIQRVAADEAMIELAMPPAMGMGLVGFPDYTFLRWTDHAAARPTWQIVMDDSAHELRRHLPIWLAARGCVLITGLGLGCVVRGLLAKPDVEHIDVVELDRGILDVVGAEFSGTSRVTLFHGDALRIKWPAGTRWDFAWHDLWIEQGGLQFLHAELLHRYRHRCGAQGAWAFPRGVARLYAAHLNFEVLGAPRFRASMQISSAPENVLQLPTLTEAQQ
jgi:hypothetical protein